MWRKKWCNWLCNLPGQAVIWWGKRDNMTSTKGVRAHSPRDCVRLISSSMWRSGSTEGQNHQPLTFFIPKSFFPPMWQWRESFTFTYLSNFKGPRSVQRTNPHWQAPALLRKGRMGGKELNKEPGVFLLPPRTLVSPLRHKKHSAGWISVTKLSRGEALQQPGRDKAAYPQGRSSAAASAAGSLVPFTGVNFICARKSLWFSEPNWLLRCCSTL